MVNHHYSNKTAALRQHGEEPGGQLLHLIDRKPLITMACHSTQQEDSYIFRPFLRLIHVVYYGLVLVLYGCRQRLYCSTRCEDTHFNKGRQGVFALVVET